MGMTNVWHIEETDTEQTFSRCPWAIDLSKADFQEEKETKAFMGRTGLKLSEDGTGKAVWNTRLLRWQSTQGIPISAQCTARLIVLKILTVIIKITI
jgi:hypothetical protein